MADIANIELQARFDQLTAMKKELGATGVAYERMVQTILGEQRLMEQAIAAPAKVHAEAARRIEAQNKRVLDTFARQYEATQRNTRGFSHFGQAVQQTGYQVGDFLVQVQSGTNAFVAFGQQATQLAGLLYLVDARWALIAGTVASIAIPLATAFGAFIMRTQEADSATRSFEQSLKAVKETINSLELESDTLRLGFNSSDEANLYREILQLREQLNQKAEEYNNTTTLGGTQLRQILRGEYNDLLAIYNQKIKDLVTMRERVKELEREVEGQKRVKDYVEQSMQAMQGLQSALRIARGEASTFVGVADNLASALARGAAAWGAILSGPFIPPGAVERYEASGSADAAARNNAMTMGKAGGRLAGGAGGIRNFSIGGGGGGGGGGSNPIEQELESLRSFLQSEAEIEIEAYQQRQDTLRQALEQRMITMQEFNELEKELKIKHNEEMAQIDAYRYGNGLQVTQQWFSDMASAMQSGGERMARAGRIFNAAIALQNSYVAFTEVLKDPAFIGRPFARFAAASAILAQGLSAVAAIRGGGSGGGGGSVGRVQSASAPTAQTVYIEGLSPDALFTGQTLSNLFESFYKENDNRGKVFVVAR